MRGRAKRQAAQRDAAGGAELARLALRGVVGTTMLAHGVRHARTLSGTAGWFDSIGFRQPTVQAGVSAGVETACGVALLAGAGTPLAATGVVATLGVAAGAVHLPNGFFITKEGYEYVLTLSTAAVALAALGPGRCSVDARYGLPGAAGSARWGLAAATVGAAAAVGHLRLFFRRPPSA